MIFPLPEIRIAVQQTGGLGAASALGQNAIDHLAAKGRDSFRDRNGGGSRLCRRAPRRFRACRREYRRDRRRPRSPRGRRHRRRRARCWRPSLGASRHHHGFGDDQAVADAEIVRMRCLVDDQAGEHEFGLASAPAVSTKLSGIAIHSGMPRARSPARSRGSCRRASAPTCWRTALAAASISSLEIGLRFCGMVRRRRDPARTARTLRRIRSTPSS